jgi:hypothetical protein
MPTRGMRDTWISGSDVNSFCCYGLVHLLDSWLCLRSLIKVHFHLHISVNQVTRCSEVGVCTRTPSGPTRAWNTASMAAAKPVRLRESCPRDRCLKASSESSPTSFRSSVN